MRHYFIFLLLVCIIVSCDNGKKRVPVYYDVDSSSETEFYAQTGDMVTVPFRNENGVKYVQVKVNGVGLEMIFDTGCSGTLISLAEANYLAQKGKLTQEDILGTTTSQIADGSMVDNMVVNLKEVIIHDRILCSNVVATVSSNVNAPLLLGNEILDRVATVTIDNESETLNFKLK